MAIEEAVGRILNKVVQLVINVSFIGQLGGINLVMCHWQIDGT